MSIAGMKQQLDEFIKQSERVLNVTHKPGNEEFRMIATSTAIGMAVVGLTGFAITMISYALKSINGG